MYKVLTISSSLNDKKFINYLPKAIVSIEDGKYLFCEIEKKTDEKTGKFYFSPKNIKFYDKNDLKIIMPRGETDIMLNNEKSLHFIGKVSPLIKELLVTRMNDDNNFSAINNNSDELPCYYNAGNLKSCIEKMLNSKK